MISPMSQGLFHRAISNSGGLAGPARSGVARQQATRLAELMNCPTLDTAAIIECLRRISPEDMIYSGVSFPIVVESFVADEPAFIDQRNYNNRFSNFAQIPWLVGMNSEESLLYLGGRIIKLLFESQLTSNVLFAATVENIEILNALLSIWDFSLPSSLGYSHLDVTAQGEITRRINQFYFGDEGTPTNQLNRQDLLNVSDICNNPYSSYLNTLSVIH